MQLSITERRRIERWRHAKVPVDEMARVLRRCRSTIFRDLKRNHFSDESMPKHDGYYYGSAAQLMTADRRAWDRKMIKYPELCKRVIDQIMDAIADVHNVNTVMVDGTSENGGAILCHDAQKRPAPLFTYVRNVGGLGRRNRMVMRPT